MGIDREAAKRFILERGTARERAEGLWVIDGREPDPAVVKDFLSGQGPDGGFGGIGRTITALVHYDALGLPSYGERPAGVHSFLLARQGPDGGWDELAREVGPSPPPWETPGDPRARAYLTAAACLELTRTVPSSKPVAAASVATPAAMPTADDKAKAVDRGLAFLLERRHPNGRFEGFWHTTWLAVSALAARCGPDHPAVAPGLAAIAVHAPEVWEASQLAWMLQSFRRGGISQDRPPIPALLTRLETSQRPDGSWGSEDGPEYAVFATIESLRALQAYLMR